jgi:hypothetical protein
MTDMAVEEAVRDPGLGKDRRLGVRSSITQWIERNRYRIRIVETSEGTEYAKSMANWHRAGSLPALRPDWADRGEAGLLRVIRTARHDLPRNATIIVLVDDRDARAAVRLVRADIDLMGTQTFIRWIAEDFGIELAETAWTAILMATDRTADPGEEEHPVHIRKRPVRL